MNNAGHTLDLVGTAEAARMLGNVAISTITRWAGSGELPIAFKAPGKNGAIYFQRADVERIRAEREQQAEVAESA